MKTRSLFALLLALALSLSLLAGCGKTGTAPDAPANELTEADRETLCYKTTGLARSETVLTADGVEIPADMYLFWLYNCASYIDSYLQMYGSALDWAQELDDGLTMLDYVRDSVLDATRQQVAVEKLAEQYGVTLGAEELAAFAEQRAEYVEYFGSEEEYLKQVDLLGLGEESWDRINRADYLYQGLYTLYMDASSPLYCPDEQFTDQLGEYVTADHILLLSYDPTTYTALSEEETAAKQALAQQLCDQIRASNDPIAEFEKLADEYSEDADRPNYPTGFTFTKGEMMESFETAAFELAENTVSDVVETSYGWHIILRRPLEEDSALEIIRSRYFDTLIAEATEAVTVTGTAALDEMDIPAVYAGMLDLQMIADAERAAAAEASDPAAETAEPESDETAAADENDGADGN